MNPFTTINQIQDWIKPALTELAKHKLQADKRLGEAPSFDLRIAPRTGTQHQLQMWWTKMGSRVTPEMIWDYTEIDIGLTTQELLPQLQFLAHNGKVEVVGRPIDNTISPSKLFAYHPQRMRNHHPMGKVIAQRGSTGRGFTEAVMSMAADFISTGMEPYFAKSRLRERLKVQGRQYQDIISTATFYADFHHYGKQIFDFPAEMVTLFKRTDVDGIPLDAVHLPHESFYMHFGPQQDLQTSDGWIAEGAYVARIGQGDNQVIQICLTFAPKVPEDYVRFFEHPEPCYVQAMTAEKLKIGVGEAVDMVLAEKLKELGHQIEFGTPDIDQARAEMSEELAEAGVELQDASPLYAAEEKLRIQSLHHIWQTMLRLVVNGIAYLSAYPDDTETKWPDSAPKELITTLQTGHYKAKSKAIGKLAELGFSAINYCGKSFRTTPGETATHSIVGESTREHDYDSFTWVRGHWRRQPYGQNRTLRRLLWLMPHRRTLAGSASGQEQAKEHGHIYLVTMP